LEERILLVKLLIADLLCGYLLWSQYVESFQIALIVAGFFWMLLLFVLISSVADDFFSPCVSSIVAHLKISESVAGATFLAFGNGAPDIFGAIASVLSSPKPKAGLALGELLGAGVFVTTMVIATIIFVRPFRIDVFATLRDLIFYIIALSWILFVFLYSHQQKNLNSIVTIASLVSYCFCSYGLQIVGAVMHSPVHSVRHLR
uniref:Na_Ca_ex domain-containing protein n=1 Tax=Angiostrongylus cantonensis TaxID=6313 RepID=A0A0K0CW97_ANGCA